MTQIADVLAGREPWTVVTGDAVNTLDALPDACVDAVITDPPYCAGAISESHRMQAPGQGIRSENLRRFGWFVGDNMGTAGLAFLLRSVAFASRRVVKPSGSLLVFCDWRMLPTLAPAIESAGLRYQNLVVWDKGSMGLGTGFRAQHELVMHFTYGAPEYHTKDVANVLSIPRVGSAEREHQAQKPEALVWRLVQVVSPHGGIVLDPFCGSGTTGVASRQLGRRFIGVEADRDCAEMARRRITDACLLHDAIVRADHLPVPTLFDALAGPRE